MDPFIIILLVIGFLILLYCGGRMFGLGVKKSLTMNHGEKGEKQSETK